MFTPAAATARYMASVPRSIHLRFSSSARPRTSTNTSRATIGAQRRSHPPGRFHAAGADGPGSPGVTGTEPAASSTSALATLAPLHLLHGGGAEEAARAHDEDEQEDGEDDQWLPAPAFGRHRGDDGAGEADD